MKNNQKGIAPIFIAFIVAIILGGGYLIYQNKKVEAPTPVADTSITDTSNWKIYTNTQYGFSIQYPKDANVNNEGSNGEGSNNVLFTLPRSSQGSRTFIVSMQTKGWYNLGTSNGVLRSPANCKFYDENYKEIIPSQVNINGVDFVKSDTSGAATVQRSSATEYCVLKGETAYKLTPLIGYARRDDVPGGFDSNIDVNKDSVLTQMLSTFKLITPSTTLTNEQKVLITAREVIGALSARDYQKLEGLVSSDGLSLNQEPRFDSTKNLIAKNDVSLIPKDTKIYLWGYTDGKGDPINLTRGQFLTTYIYSNSIDYLKAPDVAVNKTLGGGNSVNTIDKDINGRTYVAFHFSGFDPKYGGMDWTTLYLVFDSVNGEYKLRGIAKDNWTI